MKIAFFSTQAYDREFFNKENTSNTFQFEFYESALSVKQVSLLDQTDAVCVFVNDKIDKEVMQALSGKGVRLIALRCAGFNNVDLEAAKSYGIAVCRVPAYSPEAVAEHTMAMLLTLNRKTHKAYNRVREQNFSLNGLIGFNLFGKTIGVVGTGKIGKAFIKIALGFGSKVLAYDLYPDESLMQLGVHYVALDELFENSDVISLHCPLTAENKYLINEDSIGKMKEGVVIVNTSRGGLIDTKAVIEGLKSKKVGALAIDVYEQEENLFFKDLSETIIEDDVLQRLMSFPNVLITAHQAFFTEEALTQIAKVTLQNVKDILSQQEPSIQDAQLT